MQIFETFGRHDNESACNTATHIVAPAVAHEEEGDDDDHKEEKEKHWQANYEVHVGCSVVNNNNTIIIIITTITIIIILIFIFRGKPSVEGFYWQPCLN